MTEPKTHTLEVPGATIAYDVREAEGSGEPILLMIGSPMDATGFTTLAGHFEDRTVVTYDPRGVSRSRRTDGLAESTPELHADDLHRLIDAIGGGPVDIFASSGGAVNALALVARHPGQVRTLVAHEPSPRCCRTGSGRWPRSGTCGRRTSVRASGRRWRSSSR
jgi:pimeloyl-ACP methyl ester carboxylesterase